MMGPQIPKTPKTRDNTPSPCTSCDNAGENEPKDPSLCDECEKLKAWETKECSPKQ